MAVLPCSDQSTKGRITTMALTVTLAAKQRTIVNPNPLPAEHCCRAVLRSDPPPIDWT